MPGRIKGNSFHKSFTAAGTSKVLKEGSAPRPWIPQFACTRQSWSDVLGCCGSRSGAFGSEHPQTKSLFKTEKRQRSRSEGTFDPGSTCHGPAISIACLNRRNERSTLSEERMSAERMSARPTPTTKRPIRGTRPRQKARDDTAPPYPRATGTSPASLTRLSATLSCPQARR